MPKTMSNANKAYKPGKIRVDNQAKILEAAELEFAQFGYNGASIMSIAKRAGLPRPNVHYYFANKLDLYNKVLMDVLALWNEAFDLITVDDDPAEAIGGYIHAKVMYSKTNPLASKIFANELILGAPNLSEYLNEDYRTWLSGKSEVIQAWIAEGKMDPVDPYYLILLIWASTQHYADFSVQVRAVLAKSRLEDQDFDAVSRNLQHIILKGCGLTPTRSLLLS
jgi:TetR/AcrR family transcriptional regulator